MRHILLGLLFLSSLFVQAQADKQSCTFSLSGNIRDFDTQESLPFATLQLKEVNRGEVSDSSGNFIFRNLCEGSYTLICTHLGCPEQQFKIVVKNNTIKNIRMPHHAHHLSEFSVQEKFVQRNSGLNEMTMKPAQLFESQGSNIGDALKKVVGVNSLQTGPTLSKPIIQGLHSNRIIVMNQGVKLESQQWGSEHAPEVDTYSANEISVEKGASAVKYGPEAIGGVILMQAKPIRDSAGIGGEVSSTYMTNNRMAGFSGMLEGHPGKLHPLSWRVSGSTKKAGNTQTPNYYLKNTGFNEINYSGNLTYQKEKYGMEVYYSRYSTKLGIFAGSHAESISDLVDAILATEPEEKAGFTYDVAGPYQRISHDLLKFGSYLKTGEKSKIKSTFAFQDNKRAEFDEEEEHDSTHAHSTEAEVNFRLKTYTGDVSWEQRLDRSQTTIGINGNIQENTFEGRYFIPEFTAVYGGIYAIEKITFGKWNAELGGRFDYRTQHSNVQQDSIFIDDSKQFAQPSAVLALNYTLNDQFQTGIHAGTAWRAPAVNELYSNGLHHGISSVEIGNASLSAERSYNLSWNNRISTSVLELNLSVYANYINNYIYLTPDQTIRQSSAGAFPVYRFNTCDAFFRGADFYGEIHATKNIDFNSKISIIRAQNAKNNTYLVGIPSDKFEQGIQYSLNDSKKRKETYLRLTYVFVNKQWRSTSSYDFAAAPEAFHLWNVEMASKLILGKQHLRVGIGINNLLNVKYRDYMNRFRYFADEMGRNVTFRVRYEI